MARHHRSDFSSSDLGHALAFTHLVPSTTYLSQTIGDSETRWYRFTADNSYGAALWRDADLSYTYTANILVYLYGSSFDLLVSGSSIQSNTIAQALSSGETYYVKVVPYISDGGSYLFRVNTSSTILVP